MKYYCCVLLMILFSSRFLRTPLLKVTDKYALVKNPGQSWAIAELKASKLDSIFGYPITGTEPAVRTFVLVNKKKNGTIAGHSKIKVFFGKKNNNLHWQVRTDMFSAKFIYQDTFTLKKATWYELSSSNASYYLYIYSNTGNGDYLVKEKPKPGAW